MKKYIKKFFKIIVILFIVIVLVVINISLTGIVSSQDKKIRLLVLEVSMMKKNIRWLENILIRCII